MVKVTSSVGSIKGKAGNMSYFEINGVTIGRAYHTSIKNPKTKKQMEQRIKMNNILNMYKYIKGYLQQNFEGIIGNTNASSFFRSYNLIKTSVWLTNEHKEACKFVLAPYVVAQGRINSVGYKFRDGVFVTDINVGDLEINNETEENVLSSVVCANNEGWTNNDTLQIILLKQKRIGPSEENVELPKCCSFTISLDKTSITKISDIPVLESLSQMPHFSLCSVDGKLAVRVENSEEYTYAFAVVHGRGQGREKIVSSQQLCLSDNVLYDSYCSKEAFDKAYKSYK